MAVSNIGNRSSMLGRFGVTPPNASQPRGSNPQNPEEAGDVPFYASGPAWVLVFLIVGYILTYRVLKG